MNSLTDLSAYWQVGNMEGFSLTLSIILQHFRYFWQPSDSSLSFAGTRWEIECHISHSLFEHFHPLVPSTQVSLFRATHMSFIERGDGTCGVSDQVENNGCLDRRECNVGMFSILPCSIPISIHTDTSDKGRVPSAARIDLEIDSQARPLLSPSHVAIKARWGNSLRSFRWPLRVFQLYKRKYAFADIFAFSPDWVRKNTLWLHFESNFDQGPKKYPIFGKQ